MTPFDRARGVYERERCKRSFEEDLIAHFRNPAAYVLSTPTVFAMGRPVSRQGSYEEITDPWHVFSWPLVIDAFWIHLLAGSIKDAWPYLPQGYAWLGFERDNEPRFWRLRR